jgi:tRNA pseudouridine55 synthase
MKSGLLLVDKPAGITSFGVIRKARRRLGMKKIGHAGTLDSFATGLLLLGVGNGSKALSHLLLNKKSYRTRIILGATTPTLDPTEEMIREESIPDFTKEEIIAATNTFLGTIEQIPPLFSALKIQGKRASDRVRKGEEIQMKPRKTEVHEVRVEDCGKIENGEYKGLFFVNVFLSVASGFYVRSFARGLAEKLETTGFCSELERTSIGDFLLENATEPEKITPEDILPISPGHFALPNVHLKAEQADDFFHGRQSVVQNGEGECAVFVRMSGLVSGF